MPLLSSRASGSVRAFGLTVLSALTSVLDLFTRADQSGLGTIKGQKWKVWRGVWAIVSNKASSSSAGSTNALATLKFTKTDVTVSVAGADPGMGTAFWVTDGDNWYASIYTQTEVCQTCSNCNSYSGGTCNQWAQGNCNQNAVGNCSQGTFCCGNFNSPSCPCGLYNPAGCGAYNPVVPGNCNIFNSANTGNMAPPYGFCWGPSRNPSTGGNCSSPIPAACRCPEAGFCNANCCPGPFNTWSPYCAGNYNEVCSGNFNPVVCNAFFSFSCNCVTEYRISVIRSIANVVSTISNNLFSAAVQSFRTILSGNQATIQAFSTSSYTSQIGNSVVQSIDSPAKTTQHGIIKSTSSFQQGSSIDEFGVN